MIYADPSFLFSLYAWDVNTALAAGTYSKDARRPLVFAPWQRFELRNSIRLAVHKLRRSGQTVPFQPGNVFKQMEEDLSAGRLKHLDTDWRETLRLAEELSSDHAEETGAGATDIWHVASAILLRAETFWTFDKQQYELAKATDNIRNVPKLV